MTIEKRALQRVSFLTALSILLLAMLAACGDRTNTSAPAATTAAATTAAATTAAATTAAATTAAATTAAATTAAATTAAATTAAATTAAATTASATTAAATTAAATTAAATTSAATTAAATAAITPNTSVSGNVRIAIAPSSPAEDAIVDQQLANFAKAYPNVKATKEVIASDYTTKIQTELAGGSPPDVFYVDSLIAPDLIADKQLESD